MKSESFRITVGKKVALFLESLDPQVPLGEVYKLEEANLVSFNLY
jgi:hypothetical protein